MRAPGPLRRSRRAPPRRWLLLCAVAILGQIAAPALAWCLHDGAGAHVESALTDCDHADPQHQMVDAQQPGAAVAQGGGPATMPVAAIFGRLLLADWLEAGSSVDPPADRVGGARPPPLIEHLAGHTTRLLI